MSVPDPSKLQERLLAGERTTDDLWLLRRNGFEQELDEARAQALSDVWNLVFTLETEFPKLEAAKALVETALQADSTYPILTNDGLIYDALSIAEREKLAQFIRQGILEADAPLACDVLNEFANQLIGEGPQV